MVLNTIRPRHFLGADLLVFHHFQNRSQIIQQVVIPFWGSKVIYALQKVALHTSNGRAFGAQHFAACAFDCLRFPVIVRACTYCRTLDAGKRLLG